MRSRGVQEQSGAEHMTDNDKTWIDDADYEQLLGHWRFAAVGDSLFQGDTGQYYKEVMAEKRKTADHVGASKRIGWGR